jgi:lipid-binding SYLF domain-containing protein
MRKFYAWVSLFLGAVVFLAPGLLQAANNPDKTVRSASNVLEEIMRIPEKGLPPALLKDAYGVAVLPGLLKAGFVVGGRYGNGVLSVREGGRWSNPSLITLMGGSVGWQIGAESTDVILVFKTRKSINAISQGKFTLGAQASVAAGPVGRSAEAATDVQLQAEIYSYSRSRGLFAGVALDGAALQIDDDANAQFYGSPGITSAAIFESGKGLKVPASAASFKKVLTRYTPK